MAVREKLQEESDKPEISRRVARTRSRRGGSRGAAKILPKKTTESEKSKFAKRTQCKNRTHEEKGVEQTITIATTIIRRDRGKRSVWKSGKEGL